MTEEAFLALFDRYRPMVYALALSYTKSPQDAEDVCQTAFLKLIEQPPAPGKEKPWLARVAVNQCKSLLRAPWRRRRAELDENTLEAVRFSEPEDGALWAAVLSATALASVNQEKSTRLWSGTTSCAWVDGNGMDHSQTDFSKVVGLDLVDGRYLLTGDEAGTVVDITGQFSAEEAYVFTREKDPEYGSWSDLVVGGTPDDLGWAEVIYKADGSFGGVSGVYKGRPAWLENYYLTHGLEKECQWIDWKDTR